MKAALCFVSCFVCSCIKWWDSNRFWPLSGWRPPRTNRLPKAATDPILTHFPFVCLSYNLEGKLFCPICSRKGKTKKARRMKNVQCLLERDFSKLMECPLCWDRMMVMDEWKKGKIRTTIWSLERSNNDLTSADGVVCDQVAPLSSRVWGTGERYSLYRITHLHF